MADFTLFLKDENAQLKLAASIARHTKAGCVIFLQGDLGAGKTTFVRGFLQSLGFQGNVKSPTYTLVEPYELGDMTVFHFDLYRLGDPEELEYLGIRDYFTDQSICLIEWPERGEGVLPLADLLLNITVEQRGRRINWQAQTEKGRQLADKLKIS